jgi:hypothetical protein
MSEIKRYSVADILCLDEQIDLCKYKDAEPIIQRNKELEAELARLREQKPAQEIPAELVEWANSWKEDDSDMTSYLIGCNDMKHFVKSQLEKMKGRS